MVQENNPNTKSKEELVKLLKGNVRAFNKYREETNFEPLDLSEGKLQGATLTGANLAEIDFTGATFEYANMVSANLSGCIMKNALLIYSNLTQANLTNADLEGADLTGAQFEGANLDGANLSMALFSQANLTNVSLNQSDLESTNFCSANLSDTNFKNALNVKYCIFDKNTRWPSENYLPRDFNPGKGMYGSEEDFSIEVTEQDDSYTQHSYDQHSYDQHSYDQQTYDQNAYQENQPMTAEQLKIHMMDNIEITGKGLPEIEKKQILLDRKLDFVIASMKVLTERIVQISEQGIAGGGGEGYDSYGGFEGSSSGGMNAKLQELDDKVENIAGILTRFPVKSLEETYKLTDVINRIETTQGDIHQQLTTSVLEVTRANEEIQSILGGKLRASYISGLDKMFEHTVEELKTTINKSQETIIKENNQLDFNLDESFIVKELEQQVTKSTAALRQDLDRKLGTHGLFLKQMDEKIEKLREKADVETLFNQLRDDFDYKIGQLQETSEHLKENQDQNINNLGLKIKQIDMKIDVLSETSTLNAISNLIAEFGSGFSTELQQVKEAAMAIENRLKGLTGEVDLSTDFAIESIAQAIQRNLGRSIADAIEDAQTRDSGLQELANNINQKLELLGKVFDAKTNYLESRVHEAVKDASVQALSSADLGLAADLQDLRNISESLAQQINEIKMMGGEDSGISGIKDELVKSIKEIIAQTDQMPLGEADADEIQGKAANLQEMSSKIAEKLDQLYENFDERSDVLEEKVDEIAQSELENLMSEFSEELEELRSNVSNLDSNTRDSIRIQGISSQEVINSLREDLTASVDEVLKSVRSIEQEGLVAEGGQKLSTIKDDISEKAEILKNITDRISGKMENLFSNISSKTQQLETKVDILAQTESDSADIINDLLAEFETDLNTELKSLKDMLSHIEGRLNDPTFSEVTTEIITRSIIDKLTDKVEYAVDKTNDALIAKISGIGQPEEKIEKVIKEDDYDDSFQGDIQFIKDVVSDIREKLPSYSADTVMKVNEKLDELQNAIINRTGIIENVMNEIVKETSSLPAASKSFDISDDLRHLKELANTIDSQIKEVETLEGKKGFLTPDEIKEQINQIENQTKLLAEEYGLEDIGNKMGNLKDVSLQIAQKMEDFASQIGDNIDIAEQLSSAAEDETRELLDEFTAELEDMREYIHTTTSMTQDSIKSHSIANEESINKLREDISAALDRMSSAFVGTEKGTFPFAPTIDKVQIEGEIAGKQAEMKAVSDKISDKMESLLETINKKTQTLENKVDILAQSGGDSVDIFSEILAEFKDELIVDLKDNGLIADDAQENVFLSRIDSITSELNEIHNKVSDIKTNIESSPVDKYAQVMKDALKEANIGEIIKDVMISATPDSYEAVIADNIKDINNKLNVLENTMATKTGSIVDVMNEIVKEASSLPAATKTFDISDDLKQLKTLAKSIDSQIKDVEMLEARSHGLTLDSLKEDIELIETHSKTLSQECGLSDIEMKVSTLKDISEQIVKKVENLAQEIGDNIDLSEQIASIAEDEAMQILDEFTSELEEVREFIHTTSSITQDSIKSQSMMTEDSLIKLREEMTAAIDRMSSALIGVEKGTIPFIPTVEKVKVEEEIAVKQSQMKEVSKKITDKMEALLDTINKKTETLEQKVDIIAQSESDSQELINDALYSFKDVLLKDLQGVMDGTYSDTDGEIEVKDDQVLVSMIDKMTQDIVDINENITFIKDTFDVSSAQQVSSMAREVSEMNEKLANIEDVINTSSQKEVIELVNRIEESLSDKIHSLKDITEDVNNNLLKLDESTVENVLKKLDMLIDSGIEIDTDVIVDNVKAELESKIADMNIEEIIQGSTSNLSHKIEKLYEDVMDLTIALESKIDDLSEKDPGTDIQIINDNLNNLKDINLDLAKKLESLSEEISVDAVTDMITDIETSISREVEFLRGIGETINQGFTELEATFDTKNIENNLDELIEFNSDVAAKLDKVLDATGNIDSDALLERIKEHLEERLTDILDQDVGLEQILDNLGSDLTEKLTHVLDNNQEIDTKLDKIIEQDKAKQVENIMGEVHNLKTVMHNLIEKVEMLKDETQALNIEDQLMELQRDIESKVEFVADVANTDNIVTAINENLEEFYQGIMEKTAVLQEKIEAVNNEELAEGIDNITADISMLRNLTEDITERVEKVINATESLQLEGGLQNFKEQLEEKLNTLLENDQSLNLESLLSSIGNNIAAKLDDYYETSRSYISDVISTLEENILAATNEVTVSDFTEDAEDRIKDLQLTINDITSRVQIIQDLTESRLITKEDIEDLFSNIDAITVSLNEKTDGILQKIQSQLDESGISNIQAFKKEMEKRLESVVNATNQVREKIEIELEGNITDQFNAIGESLFDKLDKINTNLVSDLSKIEAKVDTVAAVDIVSQIDSLVSDVLVELDQEVGRIGKITANIDKNIVTLDKNIKTVDNINNEVSEKVDDVMHKMDDLGLDIKNIPEAIQKDPKSKADSAIESLVQFMQKDADQKLLLMKELIHSTTGKGPAGELETRLKKLEEHIASESKKHDAKLKNVLGSVKTLLEDIESLKGFSPLPEQ